jgi:hypothetical protein
VAARLLRGLNMPTSHYVWTGPSGGVSVRLSQGVIRRLSFDAIEAFRSVPHRGLEIGGILLGRVETLQGVATVTILDFVPVESEHREGPYYRLSKTDLRNFQAAFAQNRDAAVGLYRTHTRSQALGFDDDDWELLMSYFNDGGGVFLLVQPRGPVAVLGFPQNGSLAIAHEFPFRVASLAAVTETDSNELGLTRTLKPSVAVIPANPPAVPHQPSHRWSLSPIPVWGVLAAVVAGVLVVQLVRPSKTVPAVPAPHGPSQISLNVERNGPQLRIRWEPNSEAVRRATHAALYIVDGNHKTTLELAQQQLNSGSVAYRAQTPEVMFRLNLATPNGDIGDSIRVLGAAPAQSVQTAALIVAPPVPRPAPVAAAPRRVNSRPKPEEFDGKAERAELVLEPSPRHDVLIIAPTLPEAPASVQPVGEVPLPAVLAAIPVRAARLPDPAVTVTAEPVATSGLAQVVGKIPLMRRLRKQPQAFVPPVPIHEARPNLTARDRHDLSRPVSVDVKVYVTESGKVDYAELLSNGLGQDRNLATAAVFAARQWQFSPARLGEESEPGEVVLHFRFNPGGGQ